MRGAPVRLGEQVHYVAATTGQLPACRPAIVGEVAEDPAHVSLAVLGPDGWFLAGDAVPVDHDPGRGEALTADLTCRHWHAIGTWHRPGRL